MALCCTYLYIFTFVGAFVLFMLAPKTSDSQSVVIWLPVSFILLLCYDAFFVAFLSIVNIPVNLISSSCINILACGFLAWYIHKRGTKQIYHTQIVDYIALVLCVLIAVICGYFQFGAGPDIRYLTSDPAVHFQGAMAIVDTGVVKTMYLAWYFIAMCIEAASSFLPVALYYKVFLLCDVFFLFIGSAMLYSLIARMSHGSFFTIFTFALMILYTLGYPLTGMLFGFCYLGVGVSVCAAILFIIRLMGDGSLNKRWSDVLVMLGIYGALYLLFVVYPYYVSYCFALPCSLFQDGLCNIYQGTCDKGFIYLLAFSFVGLLLRYLWFVCFSNSLRGNR